VRDNAIYQENPSNSNGAGYLFAGRAGGGGIRRALLRFDVATAVPQNARIDSVELTLVVSRAASAAVLPATLHRILADWGEAGSSAGERAGAGAAAQPGDATWTARFFGGATWSSQGGDFATAPSAGGGLGGVGTYTIASTATLVSDVQMWLDSPQTNFGWILRGDESEAFTARRINSREFNDAQLRPVLRITYSDTPPAGNVPLPPWTLLAQGSLLGALLWKRQSKR
jgi:hypothetical protein